MNGAVASASTGLLTDPNWKPAFAGDFNGDGKTDILWRADNGTVALWQMNGAQVAANITIGNVGTEWRLFGTGDFDGDGKGDILWRNHDGSVAVWEMNGAQIAGQLTVGPLGPDSTLGVHHFDLV
jgi:hypothetical protein